VAASQTTARKKQTVASVAPRYQHQGKDAVFLGRFDDYDLYHQHGHLVARFSDEPTDYLLGMRQRQYDKVPALSEAVRLAEQRGLELDTSKERARMQLKTSALLKHAQKAGRFVACFRLVKTYRKDHTLRAFPDGRVEDSGWETTARDFLRFYPDRLGRIWHLDAEKDRPEDDED
jgi:hypothetical protein